MIVATLFLFGTPDPDLMLHAFLIRTVAGAWADTVGVIQAMNAQKQSVTINVELFGRETPVEISFAEIKRV